MTGNTRKRPLTRVVPVRVSREHKSALRRWAREAKVDVSKVMRDLIDEESRRREAGEPAGASATRVSDTQVGVAA